MTHRFGRGRTNPALLRRPSGVVVADSGPWQPTDLTGIRLWLRGDLGVTDDGGGDASAWADQSGNGNDFQQTTDADRPAIKAASANLGGQDALGFDGTEFLEEVTADQLATGAGVPFDIVIVFYAGLLGSVNQVFSNRSGLGAGVRLQSAGGSFNAIAENSSGTTANESGPSNAAMDINFWRCSYDGADDIEAFVDGTGNGATTAANLDAAGFASGLAWAIGGNPGGGSAVVEVGEIIMTTGTAMNAGERASLAAYLDARYSTSKGAV